MFESAELGQRSTKPPSANRGSEVARAALLDAQFELRENGKFPVVILISGVDGAGKGRRSTSSMSGWTRAICRRWLFPRRPTKRASGRTCGASGALPPPRGTGIFAGSWYPNPIAERIRGELTRATSTSGWTRSTASRPCWSTKARWSSSSGSTCQKGRAEGTAQGAGEGSAHGLAGDRESWARLKTYDKLRRAADMCCA